MAFRNAPREVNALLVCVAQVIISQSETLGTQPVETCGGQSRFMPKANAPLLTGLAPYDC